MKKIALIIGSAFTFSVFGGLLLFAMFSNTYGINVDDTGLFPKLEISVAEQDLLNTDRSRYWGQTLNANQTVTLINDTGYDIFINEYGTYAPNTEADFDVDVYSSGAFVSANQQTIVLKPIPNDYDYYFASGLFTAKHPVVNVNISPGYDQQQAGEILETSVINNETTIKDGDSYEIKLPE